MAVCYSAGFSLKHFLLCHLTDCHRTAVGHFLPLEHRATEALPEHYAVLVHAICMTKGMSTPIVNMAEILLQ